MNRRKSIASVIICLSIGIFSALLYIRFLSPAFAFGTSTFEHPYTVFITVLMLAGIGWLGFIGLFARFKSPPRQILWFLFVIGVFGRLIFFGSTPIYEDDWQRYLWDGAVALEGINPYVYPPDAALERPYPENADIARLKALSNAYGQPPRKINYPELTTIYPPVATGVFVLAAWIEPFNLNSLRLIYGGIDLSVFMLLLYILTHTRKNPIYVHLYWLNPVAIYATYNALHMDIILLPFLLLALAWARRWPVRAAVALGVAAAVKIWPIVLAPALFGLERKRWLKSLAILAVSGGVMLCLMLPLILSINQHSGLLAYMQFWVRSSFLFPHIQAFISFLSEYSQWIARGFVAVFVTGISVWLGIQNSWPRASRLMLVTVALLLFSPTGYPWYGIWILVFLPFVPSYGVAFLTVMLSLYYSRFALGEQQMYYIYTNVIIPVQFVLPMLVMGFEAWSFRSHNDQHASA